MTTSSRSDLASPGTRHRGTPPVYAPPAYTPPECVSNDDTRQSGADRRFSPRRTERLTGAVDRVVMVLAIAASAWIGTRSIDGDDRTVTMAGEALIALLLVTLFWSRLIRFGEASRASAAPPALSRDWLTASFTVTVGWLLLFAVLMIWDISNFGGQYLLFGITASLTVSIGVRAIAGAVGDRADRRNPRRVIIVGTGPRARRLFHQVRTTAECCRVVGFVDTECFSRDAEIRARMLGTVEDIEELLMRTVVDEVLIALPVKSHYAVIQSALHSCERVGVPAAYAADLFEYNFTRPRYGAPGPFPAVESRVVAEDDARLVVKRAIDIFGATVGLVLLSPLLLGIVAAIKLSGPGNAIFVQERYGLHKRRFRMLKFRTMVPGAEEKLPEIEHLNEASGPAFKIRGDPRVTPVGRFLRKWSLDELPQLWNVLIGEMSLVGPRPMSVRDVDLFYAPWLMRRFSVRPGITCLWQVSGRSDLTFDDWIALDLAYIDSWSLRSDVVVLLKTIPAVLRGTGAM